DRRAANIDEEVKKRRTELAMEEQRLAAELESLRENYRDKEKSLDAEMGKLETKRTELEAGLSTLEATLQDGAERLAGHLRDNLPVLTALTVGLRAAQGPSLSPMDNGMVARSARPLWVEVQLPAPTRELDDLKDESALVDHLAAALTLENLHFTRDF